MPESPPVNTPTYGCSGLAPPGPARCGRGVVHPPGASQPRAGDRGPDPCSPCAFLATGGLSSPGQGSCCRERTGWSPGWGSRAGREAPGSAAEWTPAGAGGGERGQHFSQIHRGRGQGQSGATTTGLGVVPRGATGREPSRGWVGTKPREGLRPSAWSPLEGRLTANGRFCLLCVLPGAAWSVSNLGLGSSACLCPGSLLLQPEKLQLWEGRCGDGGGRQGGDRCTCWLRGSDSRHRPLRMRPLHALHAFTASVLEHLRPP